jgi:hypothetical protein
MKITHYSFGRIVIDAETYAKDVILFPERVFSPWWRKEGHILHTEDLIEVVNARLPVLIVGTGYNGTMRVPEEVIDYLRSKDIELHVKDTRTAVKLYNEISVEKKAAAALHLTC